MLVDNAREDRMTLSALETLERTEWHLVLVDNAREDRMALSACR